MTDPHVAVAHKDYAVRGGGEALAEELSRTFETTLYVGRSDTTHGSTEDIDVQEIDHGLLSKLAFDYGSITREVAHRYNWATADELTEYDVVITSGNEPMAWIPEDHQTVVAYVHSPPRWLYDLFHQSDYRGIRGLSGFTYQNILRHLYEHDILRPDVWVANSDIVARRINLYLDVPRENIETVYPPVKVDAFDPAEEATKDYYLHVGRLDPAKRVCEIVRGFSEIDAELLIAGDGPERKKLEKIAPDNVKFLGYISTERKRELMAGAKAGLFNALNEDFGMVPIEYMAAGTPVIGIKEGFTQYQIMDGKNGYTYERGVENFQSAIRRFENESVGWGINEFIDFASNFSRERFRDDMRKIVESAYKQTRITPEWISDG